MLSLERFDSILTHVSCSDTGLELTFEDDASFAYAQRVWDWVNGADNHNFLMVTGRGDCGDNANRIPYLVSKLAYDEDRNIARLTARTGEWKELVHTYELHVGSVPLSSADLGLERRDYTKDAALSLAQDFRSKFKVKTGPVYGELVCDPCNTSGRLKFQFVIKATLGIPTGFQLRIAPEGVKAAATINLNVASDYGLKWDKPTIGDQWTLGKVPLSGVSIPGGILTIGPVLDLQLGWELALFEIGFSYRFGATASLPDSAILQADLLSPSNNEFSGWAPKLASDGFSAQGRVSAYGKVFVNPALQLEAEALGRRPPNGLLRLEGHRGC